jgi:mannose-6-phosphate isomerase-like protein (cupin superfamily)
VIEMKKLWLLLIIAIPAWGIAPDDAAPEGFELWTATSLRDLSRTLDAKAASGPSHFAVERLTVFPNEYFLVAHRKGDGQAEWHGKEVDLFFVTAGSATLVVGGTLMNPTESAPDEKRGSAIQGGVYRKLSAGDVVRIPARTAHQVLLDGAKEFTYFVVKVKGY